MVYVHLLFTFDSFIGREIFRCLMQETSFITQNKGFDMCSYSGGLRKMGQSANHKACTLQGTTV